jgi:hypothetical protein
MGGYWVVVVHSFFRCMWRDKRRTTRTGKTEDTCVQQLLSSVLNYSTIASNDQAQRTFNIHQFRSSTRDVSIQSHDPCGVCGNGRSHRRQESMT